jgi:outer membrane protein
MRAILLLALAATAGAQQPMNLSMKRAVDLAVSPDGNARMKLADEYIRQAQSRTAQAKSAFLPNVDGSVSEQNFTRNLQAMGISSPSPLLKFPDIVGPIGVFDVRGTLTQTVFDFSAIRRWQASKAGASLAKTEKESADNQVAADAARAYLLALREEAALAAARANVELAQVLLKLSETQKLAGTGTGIEVTRAQVQLANEKQRLLVIQNDRQRSVLQLLRVIGLPLDTKIELTDKLAYQQTEAVTPAQALATAKDLRADWKAQTQRAGVSKLSYEAIKYERLPSIAGYADYGTIGLEVGNTMPTRTFAVTLKLPIFDGGRRDARRSEALSSLRVEEIKASDFQKQVDLEIRIAMESLQSAEGQAKTADEGLQLSENELAQARRRYEAGVATSVEVTDAQTRLERARDNRISALFQHNLARIELAAAMGAIHRIIQ